MLASLFVSASATDLFRLEFLKKAALEILESSDFADPLEAEAQTLDVLLRSNSLLRAEYSAETPPASPKIENVIELLKKQLLEDSALLRRISRVEGNHGVDCKAIIQSGIIFLFLK